jgi:hypothetical protein
MRCRCGHIEAHHHARGGIFPTDRNTIAGGRGCRRCDCNAFRPTTYDKSSTKLQNARPQKTNRRPRQMQLFEGGHRP